jgi:hypothetical protein
MKLTDLFTPDGVGREGGLPTLDFRRATLADLIEVLKAEGAEEFPTLRRGSLHMLDFITSKPGTYLVLRVDE